MRVIKPIMSIETQKIVYYSHFHFLMSYGIIFWGNPFCSMQIFKTQKRVIRVMSGLRPNDSCRDAFKEWRILSLEVPICIFFTNNRGE
jgi:hypothetical protein